MKFLKTLLAIFVVAKLAWTGPVLLVPGVGGSTLQTDYGDPIWLSLGRFLASYPNYRDWTRWLPNYTDDSFRKYMLGFYDGAGGIEPVFTKKTLRVPASLGDSDCYYNKTPGGLCGIQYLIDIPNVWWNSYISQAIEWLMKNKDVDYFGPMIELLEQQGLRSGISLFGFPYDWRQSVRHRDTLSRLDKTLAQISNNGENKVSIISHSMGCLVIKSYLLAYPEQAAKYISKWIAIGGPFQGAGGMLVAQYFSGYNFGNEEICGCSARNLGVQSPSTFELLANSWLEAKLGPLSLTAQWPLGKKIIFGTEHILDMVSEAYVHHSFSYNEKTIAWPLSMKARQFGYETRENLHHAKLVPSIKMYALYGTKVDTPYGVTYPVKDESFKPRDLLCEQAGCPQDSCIDALSACRPTLHTVDGDGTVPTISSMHPYGSDSHNITTHSVAGIRHEDLVKDQGDIFDTLVYWLAE